MIHGIFCCIVMIVVSHWAWLTHASSVERTCYFPNGGVTPTYYQPCNATVDGDASVCCDLSTSVCGSKGLCYGSNGYLYRGGCTDPSWKSAHCPTYCLHSMKLPVKFTKLQWFDFHRADCSIEDARDTYASLVPCTHGIVAGDFCCFSPRRGNGCCNRKFQLWPSGSSNGAGIPFVPLKSTSLSASSPSSMSYSTSTSASLASDMTPDSSPSAMISVSSTPQGTSSNVTAIAVGISVPLGILLLLNLGFLLFREHRHRINRQQLIQEAMAAAGRAREGKRHYPSLSQEISYRLKGVGELDSRQVHEIHDTS